MRAGSFNGYGTVILRLPLAYEKFNSRATVNLGMSQLLIVWGPPQVSAQLEVYGG